MGDYTEDEWVPVDTIDRDTYIIVVEREKNSGDYRKVTV